MSNAVLTGRSPANQPARQHYGFFFFIVKGIFRQSLRLGKEERDKEHTYIELAAQASLASDSFSSKVAETVTTLDRNEVSRV